MAEIPPTAADRASLADWLSGLSREQLVHHIAQGVGWVYLTCDARKQTALMMADAIVCYLEEKAHAACNRVDRGGG